ncbi:MAG: trypsin [Candidatus Methanomethylicota archaeon]|jgi:S1-C subfamily serine protease|uniref:PDZ domain-containing protein n=1 Tax=Thermoproteota archaeon TaxID=2056631 RepID=A0A520KG68_9CREN|nr:MAG: PDZ domain-containing protein [Candidatus Verstraetearchaeota archaeon]TDA38483.1 MAG: trypsin [Candidatus Verstraetearchaeota archaeon]
MESKQIIAIAIFLFIIGAYIGYAISYNEIQNLTAEINSLKNRISSLELRESNIQTTNQQINTSLSDIYEKVKYSIVMIKGFNVIKDIFTTYYSEVIGSGFIVNLTGEPLVVTNFHVIDGMINGSITFFDGEAYPFDVIGKDRYSDLAILKVYAPKEKLIPLPVISSSTLRVGDFVIAIGNPYGLQSTLTSGIVSQLGRAITTETTGGYLLADLIQITTPINPGNSGGPLLDIYGRVVGITTAIILGAQNVGFAIPSDTLIREINDLVKKGKYDHPYIGISGIDIDYNIAKTIGINFTYGILIQSVVKGSPAEKAGLRGGTSTITIAGNQIYIGGDIILSVDGHSVKTMEELLSYIERNKVPGQKIDIGIFRDGRIINIPLILGIRP